MKKLILLFSFIFFSGCAHQTVHEYCTENGLRYASYDQCYAERSEAVKGRKNILSHMGDGLVNRNRINCTSSTNGAWTNTSCN